MRCFCHEPPPPPYARAEFRDPLPRLEASSLYTFLVGDRVAEQSMFGESEPFEIRASTGSVSDDDGGETEIDEEVVTEGGDDDDGAEDSGFRWGVVIGSVAGAPLLLFCHATKILPGRVG